MSSDIEVSNEMGLDLFKDKAVKFLEQSSYAYLALTIIGFAMYLAVLPRNVQNVLPNLLTLFLGGFTWIVRAKIMQGPPSEIRIVLLQWIIITVAVIIATIFAIIVYPYSNAY